jgi:hypothetical protein
MSSKMSSRSKAHSAHGQTAERNNSGRALGTPQLQSLISQQVLPRSRTSYINTYVQAAAPYSSRNQQITDPRNSKSQGVTSGLQALYSSYTAPHIAAQIDLDSLLKVASNEYATFALLSYQCLVKAGQTPGCCRHLVDLTC